MNNMEFQNILNSLLRSSGSEDGSNSCATHSWVIPIEINTNPQRLEVYFRFILKH
jgi:hypothetical protein